MIFEELPSNSYKTKEVPILFHTNKSWILFWISTGSTSSTSVDLYECCLRKLVRIYLQTFLIKVKGSIPTE